MESHKYLGIQFSGLDSIFSIEDREEEMEGDMEREVGTRKEREGEKGRARD